MPYFFILPVYFALFAGLLLVSALVRLWPPVRWASSHLLYGALGTLPGIFAGNFVFWGGLFGIALLFRHVPIEQAGETFQATLAVGFVAAAGLGLFIANAAGCVAGFVGGVWWRARRNRRRAEYTETGSGMTDV